MFLTADHEPNTNYSLMQTEKKWLQFFTVFQVLKKRRQKALIHIKTQWAQAYRS